MQTDTMYAFQVDEDDLILVDDEVLIVNHKRDEGDHLILSCVLHDDESVDREVITPPFDTLAVVVSLDEDNSWENVLLDED